MPVRDFALDSNGDIAVVNGDFAVVGGSTIAENLAAVRQSIQIRLQLFLGEYWLDESVGVDWLGSILVKNANPLVVRELLRQAIAAAPDVTGEIATALTATSQREASVGYTVGTTYSSTQLTGAVTPT